MSRPVFCLEAFKGYGRRKPSIFGTISTSHAWKPEGKFNPDDLIGNYNRNMDESVRIRGKKPISIAYVPHDSSLI